MLLPSSCAVCGRAGEPVCVACCAALAPPPADAAFPALFSYEGVGQALVTALKFRGRRGPVGTLGAALAAAAERAGVHPAVVTWPPTAAARRRARGFDQAELLARAVARRLGVPASALLVRTSGTAQAGRSRVERLLGPRFVAFGRVPGRVLVVDDVVTTGATLQAASAALRAGGAHRVDGWAVAATPAGHTRVAARPTLTMPATATGIHSGRCTAPAPPEVCAWMSP